MKMFLTLLFVVGTSSLVHAQIPAPSEDPNIAKNQDGAFADPHLSVKKPSKIPCPTCSREASEFMKNTIPGQNNYQIPGGTEINGER